MVTCRFAGRLGNQMFQAAATIAHALRNNDAYQFPDSKLFFKEFPYAPKLTGEVQVMYKEKDFSYNRIPYVRDMCLEGWFQSEKYFTDFKKDIKAFFGIPEGVTSKNIVGIHIRRGDYLTLPTKHPTVTREYIMEAIGHFPGHIFLIHTDDKKWCAENFPKFELSMREDAYSDFVSMCFCEHLIIANSSLSLMAAYLNNNPDKKIIAPKKWFGEDLPLNTKDLYNPEWKLL